MAPAYNEDVMDVEVEVEVSSRGSGKSTILSSVLHGPQDEIRNITEPLLGELQIQIKSTGICGSDVSYYKKFANGDLCACAPLSLGHEASGVVVGIGAQVNGFKIGDRVALEVGISCGQCDICRKGRYNLCKKMRFRSSAKSVPHFQGTLQERINHPAIWCHKLPDHISFDAAALLEPLSVAIHSLNRAAPTPGSTAVVIGAGTVGLLVAAMARQSGCPIVTITDISAHRVQYALDHGFATHGYVIPPFSPSTISTRPSTASSSGSSTPSLSGATTPLSTYTIISSRLDSAKNTACDILSISSPDDVLGDNDHEGADITFECTGKEICMQTAIYSTKPGGKVIMVGMGTPIQTLPLSAAHLREVDIVGVFRYANTYATGIRMLGASVKGGKGGMKGGLPSLDAMVTHRVRGLGNAKEAFELAGRTTDDEGGLVLKVVIEV
ncbi:alcohol dehydrogenase GroES-like domain-containing protein [Sclerotinia borealis F-4128]|uniref:Alcohol dehydrogenase GroES-like domain-containing protein n=1 Tax=Sclerotinia borealis (strain F-4128) TaxID=1432307 RepID=W9CTL8_SCLBF|nr:alcohol dehydrogenase GroES-like domain-containing protein [Sclerotinia borealis F-4128]